MPSLSSAKKKWLSSKTYTIAAMTKKSNKALALVLAPLLASLALSACGALPGSGDNSASDYRPNEERAARLVDIYVQNSGYGYALSSVYQREDKIYQVVSLMCLDNSLIKDGSNSSIDEEGISSALVSTVEHRPDYLPAPWSVVEGPRMFQGPSVPEEEKISDPEELAKIKAAARQLRPEVDQRCQ